MVTTTSRIRSNWNTGFVSLLWRSERITSTSSHSVSDEALWFIGGILKHAKTINAFTNPTTNSYKRLIPGFEAPVLLAYSARNRSASVRIPWTESPKAKRVECRFPDPCANPYHRLRGALQLPGIDGIGRKTTRVGLKGTRQRPPPEELAEIPTVCGSLREALQCLEADHEFLLHGDVFTEAEIEGGDLALKWPEVYLMEHTPHPVEYQMFFSL